MNSTNTPAWTGSTWSSSTFTVNTPAPSSSQQPPAEKANGAPGWHSIDSPVHSQAAESHSRFLHVAEQGTYIRRAGTRIRVTRKDAVLLDIPAAKLQGVLLYGNVQVSTQCLRNMLDEGVWLSLFTRNGVYKGRLQPPAERGGRLRVRQWERSRDEGWCLEFARAVVRAKIVSQQQVAAAYAKNYLADTLGEAHSTLRDALARLQSARQLDEIRGIEGASSRAYFDLFRRLNRSELPFDGREKHPPTDPINALLSFGYTLLTRELEGLLEAAGLDPTVGFYHMPHADRPSLACDWVEEFRHEVVDRLVLNLINRAVIKASDFENREEKGGIRLTQDGLRKFLRGYETGLIGLPTPAAAPPDTKTTAPPDAAPCSAPAPAVQSLPNGFRPMFLSQLGRLLDALGKPGLYRPHFDP
jgi:CRISPR-associated protein Cas1